jgi:hypothetical protein
VVRVRLEEDGARWYGVRLVEDGMRRYGEEQKLEGEWVDRGERWVGIVYGRYKKYWRDTRDMVLFRFVVFAVATVSG